MTRCVLYRDADGMLTGFSVKGHSGYAEAGSDIVCAAASVLATTCINALESVVGVVPQVRTRDEPPLLEAKLPPFADEGTAHDAQLLLLALRQGFSDLSEAYPQNFHLSIHERRETP